MTTNSNNLLFKDHYFSGSMVQVGNRQTIPVSHTCVSFFSSKNSSRLLHLKNMLCVPPIAKKFLNISQITKDNGVIVEFHSNHYFIKDKVTRETLLQGTLKDGLYQLQISLPTRDLPISSQSPTNYFEGFCHVVDVSNIRHNGDDDVTLVPKSFDIFVNHVTAASTIRNNASINGANVVTLVPTNSDFSVNLVKIDYVSHVKLWHARLGHLQEKTLKHVMDMVHVSGSFDNKMLCEACQYGKMSQAFLPLSTSKTNEPLELVFSYMWCPAPICSFKGF